MEGTNQKNDVISCTGTEDRHEEEAEADGLGQVRGTATPQSEIMLTWTREASGRREVYSLCILQI